MGLNESYSAIRGQIFLMLPLPSVNTVYSLLLQEKAHREVSLNPDSLSISLPVTFAAQNISSGILPTPPTTTLRSSSPRDHDERHFVQCIHCNKLGHTVGKCYSLHGYPLGHKFHKKPMTSSTFAFADGSLPTPIPPAFTKGQYYQLIALLNSSNASSSNHTGTNPYVANLTGITLNLLLFTSSYWIIDTDATDHMTSSSYPLTHVTSSPFRSIHLFDGSSVDTFQCGHLQLTPNLSLMDV